MKTKDKFPIKGWQWIFYIFGWITGVFNLIFWGIFIQVYANKDKKTFKTRLHKAVLYWGIGWSMFLLIFLLLLFFRVYQGSN